MSFKSSVLAILIAWLPAAVLAEDGTNEWQFTVTPYLWLPTIEGTLNYELPPGGGGNPSVGVGPTDWLDLLNFAALVNGSARKGKYSISSDLVYLSMSRNGDGRVVSVEGTIPGPGPIEIPVGVELALDSRTDLDGLQWSVDLGYELLRTDRSLLDVFVGARYFDLDVSTRWSLSASITLPDGTVVLPADGTVSNGTALWDAIIGVRGQIGLGESRWSFPYRLDLGTGDSESTLNVAVGLSRQFGWGELLIAYRHLEYDEGPDGLLEGFSFSGPAVGARWTF
ncbi:MAG: hypothetical protein OEW35_15680 [Gammaproteobacteria bacterium]|nr:hypothetical protein [Gammaproteobacteria bacterium]MDH4256300.1 hypothetical protein [Gammaproteobacteria bacterium]MDH5311620.1 hypothetical protein [Gammaproteobacteria bacterium]